MSFDPQTQVLIDQGVISVEQAQAAADAAPAADEIVGFARCMNTGCGRYDEPREIRLHKQTVFHRAPGLPLIESSSTHLVPHDDADTYCPIENVTYTEDELVSFIDDDGANQTKTVTHERTKVVGCGGPCAIQEHAPPTYQKMMVV